MDSKFYLSDFLGLADSSAIKLASGETKRLENQPCKFVKLSRWNVTDDNQFTSFGASFLNTNDEIYYGFNGKLFGQLFVSQSTELLPVSNLNMVTVSVPAKGSAATIQYAWFW